MFRTNYTGWALSKSFSIGNLQYYAGNAHDEPKMPENSPLNLPPIPKANTLKPYGVLGYAKDNTKEFLVDGTVIGYLDNRVLTGFNNLSEGECCTYSDNYTLATKNDSIQSFREDGNLDTHLTSAENTKTIVETIFTYLITISSQLNALSNSFKEHTHEYLRPGTGGVTDNTQPADNSSSAPEIDYFTSEESTYPNLTWGESQNTAEQMYIQDSTSILTLPE